MMMKNLGEKARKKDIRKMMKEADLNKDGKISFSGNFLFVFNFHVRILNLIFSTSKSTQMSLNI